MYWQHILDILPSIISAVTSVVFGLVAWRRRAVAWVLPFSLLMLAMAGWSLGYAQNLAPFAFALTGLAMVWGFWRLQAPDVAPGVRHTVVDGLADGVIVIDERDNIKDFNPAARRILGRPLSEARGQSAANVLPGWAELIERYGDVSEAHDQICVGQGETRRDLDLRVSLLYDRRGRFVGRLAVLRDVTERESTQREMRHQALAFENISDSVILTNMDGCIIDCNPATESMFGYSREELLGKPPRIWHRPDESAALTKEIVEGIERDGRWSGEISCVRKDGVGGVCEVVVIPLRDEHGRQIACVGVSHDITERKQAEASLRAQMRLFESLVAVARATSEQPSLDATLQSALDVMATLTGAEYGSLFLLDETGSVTPGIVALGRGESLDRHGMASQVMEEGLAGWVAQHRRVAVIYDTVTDDRWMPRSNETCSTRSALAVPIVSGTTVLGVLTLAHSGVGRFNDEHAVLLQAAADQMALAIRNAQNYDAQRRMADRQATLYNVLATAGKHLDPETLVHTAVETIAQLTGWPAVAVLLPDDAASHLVIQAAAGELSASEGRSLPTDQGIVGRAFLTVQTQYAPDVSTDPDYVSVQPSIRCELVIPLKHGDRVLGVLAVESDRVSAIDENDVLLAESLAEAIALALSNARLYAETRQHVTDLSTLYTVTQIVGQSLALEDVLQAVLPPVLASFDLDAGLIGLFDLADGQVHLVAQHGLPPATSKQMGDDALVDTVCAYLRSHGERVSIGSLEDDVPDALRGMPAEMSARGLSACVALPLLHREESLGAICLFAREPRHFSVDEMILLETIGHHIATAIVNARLFQTTVNERRLLLTLLESSRDGIIFVGMDGRVRVANHAALEFLHLSGHPESLTDRPLLDTLLPLRHSIPSLVRVALAELRRAQQGNESPGEGECEVSPRALRWMNLPVQADGTPLGRLIVLRDVTEERMLARMRDDLTHMMVHDLRNPLSALSMALHFLGQPHVGELSSQQRVMLDFARGSMHKMLKLVNNILDVSRLEGGRMPLECGPVLLADLVSETLPGQSLLAAQKGLRLETEVPSTLPAVWADGRLVERVLQNLIGNAIKFTPADGLVKVTAEMGDTTQDGHDVGGSEVRILVSDTGPGISPDLQGRLFQKFVTGNEQESGSGLGLAFCKLAVEAHNGRIWVESEPNKGTAFVFTLPVAKEAARSVEKPQKDWTAAPVAVERLERAS